MVAISVANKPSLSNPSTDFRMLTAGELSDTVNLNVGVKALEIENRGAADIVLKVSPSDISSSNYALITVSTGTVRVFPGGVSRIWSTGSTNLSSYLTAGTASVILHLE